MAQSDSCYCEATNQTIDTLLLLPYLTYGSSNSNEENNIRLVKVLEIKMKGVSSLFLSKSENLQSVGFLLKIEINKQVQYLKYS